MSLNIAIFIESFNPFAGGNERSTDQIARELCERGHNVTILAGHVPSEILQQEKPYELLSMKSTRSSSVLRLRAFAAWAARQLETHSFDVSMSVTNAVEADVLQPRGGTVKETLARNVAMRPSVQKRLLKEFTLKLDLKQRLLLKLEEQHLASQRVKKIVAVSEYVQRQLVDGYGVATDKIQVIPNAAVMPALDADDMTLTREEMRAGLCIDEAVTVFVFVAMNPKLKGAATLWRAMELLKREREDFVTLMVGSFGLDTTEEASRRSLEQQVRVIGQMNNPTHAYVAADVTVLPTFYDPSSKVVLESLMLGRPAISTRYNGASDFIVEADVRRGEVIDEADDVTALAAAMLKFCDKDTRDRYAAACTGLADRLSMRQHVDALEQVLIDAAR